MGLEMVVGDVVQMTTVVRSTLGQNQTNVSYWICDQVGGASRSLAQVINALSAQLAPSLIAAIPASSAFQGVLGRRVWPAARKTQTYKDAADAAAGALAGDVLPSQTCGLITLKGLNAPPRSAVRHYLPSTTEAQNGASGQPVAGYITLAGDVADAMTLAAVVTDGGVNFCNMQPATKWTAAEPVALDVFEVSSNWATQRRRAPNARPDRPIF